MKISSRNTSGVKGVTYDPKRDRYRAGIRVDGVPMDLGRFKTLEEAAAVVRAKREELHGEFCNHGN